MVEWGVSEDTEEGVPESGKGWGNGQDGGDGVELYGIQTVGDEPWEYRASCV